MLILLVFVGAGSSAQSSAEGPLGDYGDAPDGLPANYARVDPQRMGSFPSLFKAHADQTFILHRFPGERVYLGLQVSMETNALLVDRDLDDGWLPGSFFTCHQAQLEIWVTVPKEATAGPIYLNALFDWDHDGRWADFSICSSSTRGKLLVEEWAIRNLALHESPYNITPGFSGTIQLPAILTGPLDGELWLRFTISSEPVDEKAFIPASLGGHGWNGQGDFIYGETEDYFTCLLINSNTSIGGCPVPLQGQPPLDPPPPATVQNRPPVAEDDTATTLENTSVIVEVLANDSDPDGDSLTVLEVTQPPNGKAVINPNGTITYIPNAGFMGTDTFSYIICDPAGLCDSAIVTITVTANATNAPPQANDDSATTDEDTPVTIAVLANDSDPDGNPITITGNTQGTHGSITCTSTQCTYAPNANFHGTDTFTYTISDGHGGTDTATVTITVTPVNDLPQLAGIPDQTINEGQTLIVNVSCTDIDGGTLTLTSGNLPAGAVFTDNGNGTGTLSYTPDFDVVQHPSTQKIFSSVQITCSDGSLTDTENFKITVNDVNRAPTLTILGDQTVAEGSNITLTDFAQCSDLDGDPLTLVATGLPGFALFSDSNDGTGNLSLTPGFNDSGTYSSNQITCSDGSLTDTESFLIHVTETNRAPVAFDQSLTTPEEVPIGITLTGTDPDGDPITFSPVSSPSNGTLSGFNPNTGTVTYTPNGNYHGPDSFTFRVNDGLLDSNIATVTITVTPVNDPPVASSQSISTPEDTPVNVTLTCSDVEGGPLTFSIVASPSNGSLSGTPPNVIYTPNANFNGNDSFTFKCNDGQLDSNTATVSITVTPVNDAPLANSQSVTTNEDTPKSITLTCSDIDSSSLSFAIVTAPAHGTLSGTPPNVTYTPNTNFNGSDSFTFKCNDGQADSNVATVTITVLPVNDPPVAEANGPYSCTAGGSATLSSAGSFDPDGTIISYQWDLDNNGSFETSGQNPTFPCTTAGTFLVTLQVTDNDGATTTDSATILVSSLCDADPVKDTSLQVQWGAPSISGNQGTVTLSVTNTGSDDWALNLIVRIQVLSGADKIASSTPSLPFDWPAGNLAPGATITFTVTITASSSGKIKLQGLVLNEDCRPEHTEGKQDKVDLSFP